MPSLNSAKRESHCTMNAGDKYGKRVMTWLPAAAVARTPMPTFIGQVSVIPINSKGRTAQPRPPQNNEPAAATLPPNYSDSANVDLAANWYNNSKQLRQKADDDLEKATRHLIKAQANELKRCHDENRLLRRELTLLKAAHAQCGSTAISDNKNPPSRTGPRGRAITNGTTLNQVTLTPLPKVSTPLPKLTTMPPKQTKQPVRRRLTTAIARSSDREADKDIVQIILDD